MSMKNKKSQSGQMTVEMVLILVILLGIASFVNTQLKEQEILQKFISVPWVMVSNMMESGVWKSDRNEARRLHPGHWKRMYGLKGNDPR